MGQSRGTLNHAQIGAIEWNRQIIARVKAGMNLDVFNLPTH